MSINIIEKRLREYDCKNLLEEENALKEITQEIILMSLARADFFKVAEFHGGTALRILHGLERFSEDLDFALLKSNANFSFLDYLNRINEVFLNNRSIGKILTFQPPLPDYVRKKIRIKLEIDINPPAGAETELQYVDFPLPFAVRAKDLPSSFAGKLHAILCRPYLKGRDWFDFLWYVRHKIQPNFILLQNALDQNGPWQKQQVLIDKQWLLMQLKNMIQTINWHQAKEEIQNFIKPHVKQSLDLWSTDYFLQRAEYLFQ